MTPACIIVFARLDSRRLPGKVLRDLDGRPMLGRVLDRARMVAGAPDIIVATSDRPIDDPIADFATAENVGLYRGAADDVARRALACADALGCQRFVRITGDSPFMDPGLVARMLERHTAEGLDVVTNIFPRTYPPGGSVEVVATSAMRSAVRDMRDPADREHVTRYFYRHAEKFAIENVESGVPALCDVNLAVDTIEDWNRSVWILSNIDGPPEAASLEIVAALSRAWSATHRPREAAQA